ncbi:MAG: ATP-binding protein [Burkholderiales bacterium]
MFRTLYSKLAATLLVLFVLLGTMLFLLLRSMVEAQDEAVNQELHLDLAARLVPAYFREPDDADRPAKLKQLFTQVMHHNPSVEAYHIDAEGTIRDHAAPVDRVKMKKIDTRPILRMLAGNVQLPLRGDDPRHPGRRKVFSVAPIEAQGKVAGYLYLVLAGEDRTSIASQQRGSSALRTTAGVMGAGLLVALFAGFVIFNLLTERLHQLARAMDAFRRAGFSERASYIPRRPDKEGDEIDRLGATYNEMAERIIQQLSELRSADAKRRDLIANISHDLRTPLASLRGYLDTLILKRDSLTDDERRNYLETAARQSERLGKLVGDLFDLAKFDAHDVALRSEPFSLAELAHDVAQGSDLTARENGVALGVDALPGLAFVSGDIGLLERVMQNLIDNAIRHTPRGGSVTIRITDDAGVQRIEVCDTGRGIPPEALDRIFDRFYTLDKSRSASVGSGGTGLGLAIAKRIVELHGSSLSVESTVGMGARFWFDIPVAPRREGL